MKVLEPVSDLETFSQHVTHLNSTISTSTLTPPQCTGDILTMTQSEAHVMITRLDLLLLSFAELSREGLNLRQNKRLRASLIWLRKE